MGSKQRLASSYPYILSSVMRSRFGLFELGDRSIESMISAVKLYELGRLSSGRAAELAGMPWVGIDLGYLYN